MNKKVTKKALNPTIRFLLLVVLFFGIIAVVLFVFNYFNLRQQWSRTFFAQYFDRAALAVATKHGEADVYLNEEKIGTTPLDLSNLSPGTFTLKLVKKSTSNPDFYHNLVFPVTLVDHSKTFIEAEIGPTEQTSWYIASYAEELKQASSHHARLILTSQPLDVKIEIDGVDKGQTPVSLYNLSSGTYKLRLSKIGYQFIETDIELKDNTRVNVDFKLYKIPLDI